MARSVPRSRFIASTSLLAAMAYILDYSLSITRLKIAFPMDPILKFDLDGLPVGIACSLFGINSAFFAAAAIFLSISLRGSPLSAFMKSLAELSTAVGMSPLIARNKLSWLSIPSGIGLRVIIMLVANSIFYPTLGLILVSTFNGIAGAVTTISGYLTYLALKKRLLIQSTPAVG